MYQEALKRKLESYKETLRIFEETKVEHEKGYSQLITECEELIGRDNIRIEEAGAMIELIQKELNNTI